VSARRAGTTASIDVLNKYFLINQQPVVSSQYWNMVHGNTPEEVLQDEEGMQIVRVLGKNLAWLLKNIEAGKSAGVELPKEEEVKRTNFIR
jgi:multimeric flavodoxin WrbA